MNRTQMMELIESKGGGESLRRVRPQLTDLMTMFPEIPVPLTIDEVRQRKVELESRIGAIGLFSALTLIEAARCAECAGVVHIDWALDVYSQLGDSIHSILNVVRLETDGPTDLEELVESLRDTLRRQAQRARARARETAPGHAPATDGAPMPTEADGDAPVRPDGASEGLPPGVTAADTPDQIFQKGLDSVGDHPDSTTRMDS